MMKGRFARFTLRLVPALNKRLEEISKRKGIPKNSLIVDILWEHADEVERRKIE